MYVSFPRQYRAVLSDLALGWHYQLIISERGAMNKTANATFPFMTTHEQNTRHTIRVLCMSTICDLTWCWPPLAVIPTATVLSMLIHTCARILVELKPEAVYCASTRFVNAEMLSFSPTWNFNSFLRSKFSGLRLPPTGPDMRVASLRGGVI